MTNFQKVDSLGNPLLNIRSLLYPSYSNGPGRRYVVWFQGCDLGCVGCWNPGTWSSDCATLFAPESLADKILTSGCTGVTFTGGEPLRQAPGFLSLLRLLDLALLPDGILLFTGYELEEIAEDVDCAACLNLVDAAVTGRYVRGLRSVRGLLGSTNQRCTWSEAEGRGRSRISEESILVGQQFEMHDVGSGILLTGFPDLERLNLPGIKRL